MMADDNSPQIGGDSPRTGAEPELSRARNPLCPGCGEPMEHLRPRRLSEGEAIYNTARIWDGVIWVHLCKEAEPYVTYRLPLPDGLFAYRYRLDQQWNSRWGSPIWLAVDALWEYSRFRARIIGEIDGDAEWDWGWQNSVRAEGQETDFPSGLDQRNDQ